MDWALSSVGDDVTMYTNRLSEMERRLFACGASAAANHFSWKTQGTRRLLLRSKAATAKTRSVTPDNNENKKNEEQAQHRDKRQRSD
jgi:hypothetical protein